MARWKLRDLFGRTACDEELQVCETGWKGSRTQENKKLRTKRKPPTILPSTSGETGDTASLRPSLLCIAVLVY